MVGNCVALTKSEEGLWADGSPRLLVKWQKYIAEGVTFQHL